MMQTYKVYVLWDKFGMMKDEHKVCKLSSLTDHTRYLFLLKYSF